MTGSSRQEQLKRKERPNATKEDTKTKVTIITMSKQTKETIGIVLATLAFGALFGTAIAGFITP